MEKAFVEATGFDISNYVCPGQPRPLNGLSVLANTALRVGENISIVHNLQTQIMQMQIAHKLQLKLLADEHKREKRKYEDEISQLREEIQALKQSRFSEPNPP